MQLCATGRLTGVHLEVGGDQRHHNYAAREKRFGQNMLTTHKGAVRAGVGDMGSVPGSTEARSYIVRGNGSRESLSSCSHGAGRAMSRNEAKRRFTVEDHERMNAGIECRKDADVIDETPAAYKSIDIVLAPDSIVRRLGFRPLWRIRSSASLKQGRSPPGPGSPDWKPTFTRRSRSGARTASLGRIG